MSSTQADEFRQAPLVPIAAAATAGVLLDRWLSVPMPLGVLGIVAGVTAWAAARKADQPLSALIALWAAFGALAGIYHHWCTVVVDPADIGHFAASAPGPVVLQGILAEEPVVLGERSAGVLASYPTPAHTRLTVNVRRVKRKDDWVEATGLARVTMAGKRPDLHVGNEVEVVGWLEVPAGPQNPGEFDYASYLRDQRIRAVVEVRRTPDGVKFLGEGWPGAAGGLAALRGWGHQSLQQLVPREQQGLALALLLGENEALDQSEWDRYQRTGIIHALAISGQHLVVLAGFAWFVLRALHFPRRRCALAVAIFLLGYALLTGGRPPVMRAAVAVVVFSLAILLRRRVPYANAFALGWLTILFLNPTDIFTGGCQLSFLGVALLLWIAGRLTNDPDLKNRPSFALGYAIFAVSTGTEVKADPLEGLLEKTRPLWQQRLLWVARPIGVAYLAGFMIWLGSVPLAATWFRVVPPVGVVIGPPVVLLTSVALLAGFLALLFAPLCWPLAQLAGCITGWSLAGCDFFVDHTQSWPGAYWYVTDVPSWWVWTFYGLVISGLTVEPLRRRWPQLRMAALAWLCVGLVSGSLQAKPTDCRCTFLAVGHGGCTVIETPDGRTFLYDAGAITGPDVTRRRIAPFLWNRGIGRIDEVFLSHADLDHFNGLNDLLDRFAVGQVTCTPTFQDNRQKPGVRHTLEALERRAIPLRVVCAGDRLSVGALTLEVLHPPAVVPEGNENARSMVLLLEHCGHRILLTGDLEGPGLQRVLSLPCQALDVMMAPHHGSKSANLPELAAWAVPKMVVSCEGPPRGPTRAPEPYTAAGARFLTTWEHGAITLQSSPAGLRVETFRTAERWWVKH